jgi:peptide/nickel transport system permease protein
MNTNSHVLRRFLQRKSSVIGSAIIFIFVFVALIGPFLCPYQPNEINLMNRYQNPSREHWLGTDILGRDTFTRLVYGARISLLISVMSTLIGSFVGMVLGVIAGYFGGVLDSFISRMLDILMAFPGLLLAIAVIAILGSGLVNTMLAVAVFSIPTIARLVRSVVITLRENEYVQACQVVGASNTRIVVTHIIPNAMGQIIVNVTLNFGYAILAASSLSFLGLGVQPPNPEWGAMLSQARQAIRSTPMASIIPGMCIMLVVLSFSMVGDGLRDALDPKLKRG